MEQEYITSRSVAYECDTCRDNRKRKVGEKLKNTRREGDVAICNDCGKIIATYANDHQPRK